MKNRFGGYSKIYPIGPADVYFLPVSKYEQKLCCVGNDVQTVCPHWGRKRIDFWDLAKDKFYQIKKKSSSFDPRNKLLCATDASSVTKATLKSLMPICPPVCPSEIKL